MSDIWRTKERMAQRYLHARRKGWPRLGPATRSLRLELESAPGNVSRVHAIGVGTKNETDEPAVVVYVTRKLPMDVVPLTDRIPESMNGVRTDVVERPQARLAACTDRRRRQSRPLVGGISISREAGPSGTLGTFVTSRRSSDAAGVYLLSNSHVLWSGEGAAAGVAVFQPGVDDGSGGAIARVARASRLTSTVPMRVDAGIARLAAGVPFSNEICMVGATEGTTDPMKKMVVVKHGRTTGLTAAPIKTVGLEALVDDPDTGRELSFVDLFLVEPDGASSQLALPGDSGSLVVDGESRKAVGLLHAADPGGTFYYAQSIKAVLKELEIDLLP